MLVIKDYYADWCKPCKSLDVILRDINDEYNGVTLKKINVDLPENQDSVKTLGIRSVPTVIFEKDGVVVEKLVGLKPKSEYISIINQYLHKKECGNPDSGCDLCCMECEVPTFEPEDCEYCREEAEESGMEYEANFTHVSGTWTCENCRRPV